MIDYQKATRICFALFMMFLMLFTFYHYAFAQLSAASISPIYKNTTESVPIYKDITKDFEYSCYKPELDIAKNSTCIKQITEKQLIGYDMIQKESKIIGYNIDNRQYTGYMNEQDGKVYRWKYDIKARNLEEFGSCTSYEKDKEVCNEIK